MNKKRIFSGIKPSGSLHIGNYLGAIKNWVALQNDYDSIFCVVDMHAITVAQNPQLLKKRTIEIAKMYLAAGVDSEKSSIFIQSHVPEHAELAWILSNFAKMGEMERMTQFKDKIQKGGRERASIGLFSYPILMAADILLYDAEVVPVGEDQLQHIEITRTLARRFNKRFGETFVVPEPFIIKEGKRIMGLDDPLKKMGKSESSNNYISLLDNEATARQKIRKAVTDSGSEIIYSEKKPALKNLINIYSLFSQKTVKEIEKMYVNKGYAEFKNDLAEIIIIFLSSFQEKMKNLTDEKVSNILKEGVEKARPLALKKIQEVKQKMGFVLQK